MYSYSLLARREQFFSKKTFPKHSSYSGITGASAVSQESSPSLKQLMGDDAGGERYSAVPAHRGTEGFF